MSSPFIAGAGLPLSHLDKMVLATRDLLLGDPQLNAWCEGRVKRMDPLAVVLAGGTAPFIAVCPAKYTTEFKVGCATRTFRVASVLVYELGTPALEDEDATESAVVEQWERVVHANPHLQVPRFGGEQLALRLTQLDAPDFFSPNLDSDAPRIYQVVTATYEKNWNSRIGHWEPEA